jgi:signal transduction histidine kinase
VVEDAKTLIGSILTQRQQKLSIEMPDDLPSVDGDEVRLTQVFVNLLANASKFAPEGSNIYIGAAADEGQVRAWVEDEGPGMPETSLESIFDRFSRGAEHEPEPGGLGLGLWIVKSIIDRHGGSISASRTAEQRTRFSFTLPVIQSEDAENS